MPMIVLCSHREGNDSIYHLWAASGIYETLQALHMGDWGLADVPLSIGELFAR